MLKSGNFARSAAANDEDRRLIREMGDGQTGMIIAQDGGRMMPIQSRISEVRTGSRSGAGPPLSLSQAAPASTLVDG